jgi:rubrerythrin
MKRMATKQVNELVLQALEHELGGVRIYETAVTCAVNDDLKKEWTKYLAQTRTHVEALEQVCASMALDPATETPGRAIVRHNGAALVQAMKKAIEAGDPAAAQLVACDCVVLAETKDHANWELLTKCAEYLSGTRAEVLKAACERVEDEEDEHLYHSKGWCRELWLQSLGLEAFLPPPEELQHVKTAIGAARAEKVADKMRALSPKAEETKRAVAQGRNGPPRGPPSRRRTLRKRTRSAAVSLGECSQLWLRGA